MDHDAAQIVPPGGDAVPPPAAPGQLTVVVQLVQIETEQPEATDMTQVEVNGDMTVEMKATLSALVRKRATDRGQITRLINAHVDRVPNLQGDALIEHLNSVHERLTTKIKYVRILDADIFDRLPDDQKDIDEQRQFDYEEKVSAALQKIETRRNIYNTSLLVPVPVQQPQNRDANLSKFLNLPKTTEPIIPKDITKYLSWVDQFSSTIHDQQCLTDMQKLQYLRQACNQNHSTIIDHIETAGGDNYARARKPIDDRLFNRRAITYNIINTFLTTPQIKVDSGQAILHFAELVKGRQADLAKLGVNTNGWDVILMCVIMDKMDDHTKREYLTKYPSKDLPNLAHCLIFLEECGLALNT